MTLHAKTLVLALAASGTLCLAGNAGRGNVHGTNKVATIGHYSTFLINNIFNSYGNNGDGSYNRLSSDNQGFEFPKGSGKHTVFEDGIVWGGFHKGHSAPKVGGSVYRHALQPGRILTPGGPTEADSAIADDPSKPEYRVYRVRPDVSPTIPFESVQASLEQEATLLRRYDAGASAQALYDAYVKDWNEWPGKGSSTDHLGLAPFNDLNGDGIYEPAVDIPGRPGAAQTLYYVANDLNYSLTNMLSGSPPIGLEMHHTIWGYNTGGALDNTIFASTILINKSGAPVDSMFLVQWADPDVGDAGDDFVGCDTSRNVGFAYNGLASDHTYGTAVPAVGFELLQGPIVPSPGDSAIFLMASRYGYRNLPMTAFNFFSAGSPCYFDPIQGPGGALEWYNLMNGLDKCSGTSYLNSLTGQPTKFVFDGDPVMGLGWIDGMIGYPPTTLPPTDRRLCVVTGPFIMANGDTQEVVVANIAGLGADHLSSIAVLKSYADAVRSMFPSLLHNSPPLGSALVGYPSPDSARVTFAFDTRNNAGPIESVSGELKDSSGTLIESVGFFDDGTHGDSIAADRIFTNAVTMQRSLRPIVLDVYTLSSDGRSGTWPALLSAITVAGPVTIHGLTIFSDNINNDGEANPGENVRFGVTTVNGTAFPLALHLVSSTGTHDIPSIDPGTSDVMSYNPSDPLSYFTVNIPSSAVNSRYDVPLAIQDTHGNSWSGTFTFDVVPLADTLRTALLAHVTGTANGSFDINVVQRADVRNDLYVIWGVDSINSSGEGGFTLKDSTDGRILLLNHALPDSLGHNIPVTDGFKVLQGTIDHTFGYRSYEIPNGQRDWSWTNGDSLRLEGLLGSISSGSTYWVGKPSSVTVRQLSSVLIRFAQTDEIGNLLASTDTNVSYAYRYLRNASAPQAKPEFGPFIINPADGFPYQDYKHNFPFAAYDIMQSPPVRLMVGYLENNVGGGTVDGKYWPPYYTDEIDNSTTSGPGEWFLIFNVPYSEAGSLALQTDILNNTIPILWWGTPTRRLPNFQAGDEFLIRAYHPPTSSDSYTFNPKIVVAVDRQMHPRSFELSQNYPNPFNPRTGIRYQVPGVSNVNLIVYDMLGREVAVLVNERKAPGSYEVEFDGSRLASGVYFYRLMAGNFVQTKKMLMLK